MNRLRSLFVVFAILLVPFVAHSATKPIRLFEVLAVRFTTDGTGREISEIGLLNSTGAFRVSRSSLFPRAAVPPEAYNRFLIPVIAWFGYNELGPQALGNFKAGTDVLVVDGGYFALSVADAPKLDLGETVNISTRATVTPGGDPVIGGFVVEGLSRRVLIRGIGPTLAAQGVATPLADPMITVFKQGTNQPVGSNDDWGQRPDADAIEQASITTGAFPLLRSSKDAALLLELEPGAYTVHVATAGTTGGTALFEVYDVP